jgi:ApbE superfamily uncharacterized protein (UPF0280 family)
MSGATVRRLDDARWHFQHGPIDCIVGADGEPAAIASAVERAGARFDTILDELVGELALLRTDLSSSAGAAVQPRGPVARRMVDACRPHAAGGRFITAMAAVAGSVAEELIGFFDDPRIVRAYVNNGGDIALHLGSGSAFEIGWIADTDAALRVRLDAASRERADAAACRCAGAAPQDRSRPAPQTVSLDGTFRITADSAVRGVATSGWRGRSFSLGIADSVTVLASTAATADAAATVIANAVDADDPAIRREPASRVRDDSDLGDRLVTCAVGALAPAVVEAALAAGAAAAEAEIRAGRAIAAALCLQGRVRTCPAVVDRAPSTRFDTLRPDARGRDSLRFGAPRPIAVTPLPRT